MLTGVYYSYAQRSTASVSAGCRVKLARKSHVLICLNLLRSMPHVHHNTASHISAPMPNDRAGNGKRHRQTAVPMCD
jgi:hypothetical protein